MSSGALPIPCVQGNKGTINVPVGATFLAISIILTGLRIFTRTRRVTAGLGWDDASIIIAVVFAIPLIAFTDKHVHYGLGRHIGCLSLTDIILADKYQAIGEIPIMISTLFSRVSVCLFLLRIFAVNISWRWTLYIIIALTAGTNIACGTAIMLRCQPLAKEWNPAIPGRCWTPTNQVTVGQVQGAISVFLDLALSVLPIYCMWKIQMSWRRKAAICGIMSLGVFTACCALVRIIILGHISGEDVTWDSTLPSLMGDLEVYISIIAANVATLRPLIPHKSRNPTRNANNFSESKTRLKYTKFSTNSNGLDTWPGFGTATTSYNTEATTDRVRDDEVSLEHMGGIRRVMDVHVSA